MVGLLRVSPEKPLTMKETFLLCAALFLSGCASVDVHKQRLVSKPNMQFSRAAVYSYSSRIMPQLQPGLAVSGGAQPTSCTVCR